MFIIAEVGSNWGSIEDCKKSIVDAKAVGADAVKFQLFSSEELYGSDIRPLGSSLPREWVHELSEKARATGVEFMCTSFFPDGLRFINPFVERHKIASSDMCHMDLIDAAIETNKEIILSTGGHTVSDLQFTLSQMAGYKKLTLLYCESVYPAYNLDLRKLSLLRDFGFPLGVSDHSREIFSVPLWAKDQGCAAFEKHVNFVGHQGADAPHSLNTTEFSDMVKAIRGIPATERSLQSFYEKDMVLMHNRRLVAKCDINPGETLVYEKNYGVYRSTRPDSMGLHPALALNVHGQRAKDVIKKGDPITSNSWE